MLIGFDLDGTLTENWFLKENYQKLIEQIKKSENDFDERIILERKLLKLRCTMIPIVPIIIITSRPIWLMNCTIAWFNFFEIQVIEQVHAKKVLTGKDRINYKANIINTLKIKIYIEDEEEIRSDLIKACPDLLVFSPQEAVRNNLAVLFNI